MLPAFGSMKLEMWIMLAKSVTYCMMNS